MKLDNVVDIIVERFRPYSIFLYGSHATNSAGVNSDYEIGVIFEDEKYISRKDISTLINNSNYSIFPFRLSEVLNYNIDTPFQKNIYINALINGGSKNLYGKDIFQNLEAPSISKDDLLADINFNLGVALSAVRVYKSGNYELANDMFYKSCLYVTRDYIYFCTNKLSLSYNETYKISNEIEELSDYKELLDMAFYLRNNPSGENKEYFYYRNISYINKFILEKVK